MDDKLLPRVKSPADVRPLPRGQLGRLADEVREFVLNSVAKTGGHLSSNLGTVELTVALHHVFHLPYDRLVWDVGHQSYPHKILTGRRDRMATIRRLGGLGGFPKRDESEFDAFGTAHSWTSISAVLGMAIGTRMTGQERRAIAVLGDGALSGGMAFEALNNVAASGADVIVILNDNEMSISPPAGALHHCLSRLMNGRFYAAARGAAKVVLKNAPPVCRAAKRLEERIARAGAPSGNLFTELGRTYSGPIDGHDIDALVDAFEAVKTRRAVAARDPQRMRLRTRGRRPHPVPRARKVRSGAGNTQAAGESHLLQHLRPLVVRHGRDRRAGGRHHPRHA
jgi:1-deoxy-D-xylulose-5-phosphate synthase